MRGAAATRIIRQASKARANYESHESHDDEKSEISTTYDLTPIRVIRVIRGSLRFSRGFSCVECMRRIGRGTIRNL